MRIKMTNTVELISSRNSQKRFGEFILTLVCPWKKFENWVSVRDEVMTKKSGGSSFRLPPYIFGTWFSGSLVLNQKLHIALLQSSNAGRMDGRSLPYRQGWVATRKGAITSKIKHAIKLRTSPAKLAQLLQPSLAFCFSLQPILSLAGFVLSFIAFAYFILLVIAP